MSSALVRWVLRFVSILHCVLLAWETVPGPSPFAVRWYVGAVEAACIALYLLDVAALAKSRTLRHFVDKKWSGTFGLVALVCLLDWLLFYAAGG